MLIYHCYFRGKTSFKPKLFINVIKTLVHNDKMVEKWFADFKRGSTNTNANESPGRPKKPQKLLPNHKVKFQNVVKTLKIPKECIAFTLFEKFSMRMRFSKEVPLTYSRPTTTKLTLEKKCRMKH